MKKILTLSLTVVLMMVASCSRWLEEKPVAFIGPDDIEDSEDGVAVWVTGVYGNWLDDMFRWSYFPFVLELDSDYISGPDWLMSYVGAGAFQNVEMVDKLWKGPYNLIVDALLAKRSIAAMTKVSAPCKDNAIGELEFLEAFAYFILVRAFGPVPIIEKDVMAGGSFSNPRADVDKVYAHIIALLEDAASKMYGRSDAAYKPGHVSAASAAGLLAKVYATMASAAMPEGTPIMVRTGDGINARYEEEVAGTKKRKYSALVPNTFYKQEVAGYTAMDPAELYDKAASWAEKVMDGTYGTVELSPYDNLWKASNRNASEFLFSVQSVAGELIACSRVHTYYSGCTLSASGGPIQTGGWIGCTYNWYRLFDETDLRIVKGVRHEWQYYYQEKYNGWFFYPESKADSYAALGDGRTWENTVDYQCLAFTTKYDDVTDSSAEYCDSSWPFLRYADVLLIYAEAKNELGDGKAAVDALNEVRKRSAAAQMAAIPGKDVLRSAIIEERAKELACEADRRWDLIRWGIYIDAMNAVMYDDSGIYKERSSRQLLFPIPQSEINANEAINENNPGWN